MRVTRIRLIKESFRHRAEDVEALVREMETDAERSGYTVDTVEAVLNMDIGRVHVELVAEKRGKLERVIATQLWGVHDKHKPVEIILPGEEKWSPLH